MPLTRKDFIMLADFIKDVGPWCEPFTEHQIAQLGNFCKTINPKFNERIWRDYIAGKCGPNGGTIRGK